jgi:GT2 family glycosyltransferase
MNDPKVSIIVLNWNGKEDTIECLNSLNNITYPNYDIVLVDNGSTDGSAAFFSKHYPKVKIITNRENMGFAEGNNIAIKHLLKTNTEYVLLLNNDTIVDREFLTELIKVIEKNPRIGIVGPVICDYKNPNLVQSAGVKINWNTGNQNVLYANKKYAEIPNKLIYVDYIAGCALLCKLKFYTELGFLNPKYFAYWEETDLCIRAKKAGYEVTCLPGTKIWHKGTFNRKISGFKQYHMIRNMFWFMRQHANIKTLLFFTLYFFIIKFELEIFKCIYYKNYVTLPFFLKGIRDGIIESPYNSS